MAACWKGYRRIVVAGRVFYWRYDDDGFGWPPPSLLVRLGERPSCTLTVRLRGSIVWGTPRLACGCIERALCRGWLRDQDRMSFTHDAVEGKA